MKNNFLIKLSLKIIIICGIFSLIPKIAIFYLLCGFLDFKRNNQFNLETINRYFFGNGILTWLLSPFNLLMDLISHHNKQIYQLQDLPAKCQEEVNFLVDTFKNNPQIITELDTRMEEKKRGMIFFKWYGKNIHNSINVPEFEREFTYVNTIGVSVFNKHQSTSTHFGPLRITLRVLYNLNPTPNDNIYIDVNGQRHFWHNSPLFIFDDTLMHQSVNQSDQLRYCMFVDVLRPSYLIGVLRVLLHGVQFMMLHVNRIFYKNWVVIK